MLHRSEELRQNRGSGTASRIDGVEVHTVGGVVGDATTCGGLKQQDESSAMESNDVNEQTRQQAGKVQWHPPADVVAEDSFRIEQEGRKQIGRVIKEIA